VRRFRGGGKVWDGSYKVRRWWWRGCFIENAVEKKAKGGGREVR